MGTSKLRRAGMAALLSVALLLGGGLRTTRAQMVTIDPAHIMQNMYDAFEALMASLDHLDALDQYTSKFTEMKTWFNDSFGEGSAFENILGLASDFQQVERLTRQFNRQSQAIAAYVDMIGNWGDYGYNPALLSSLVNQVEASFGTVKSLVEAGKKIMRDSGLSKADKINMIDDTIDKAQSRLEESNAFLEKQFKIMAETRAALQLQNLLDGHPADLHIDRMGALSGTEPALSGGEPDGGYVESVDIDAAVGDATDANNLRNAWRNGFGVVSLLLGLMSALFVVVAYVRYARGDAGAERMFLRIAVALVMVTVALSALTAFVGFGV